MSYAKQAFRARLKYNLQFFAETKQSIYDFVTADEIAALWTTDAKNQEPYLGEELFADRKKLGLDLKYIKGYKGMPAVLAPSAFDVPAKLGTRIKFDTMMTEMPFFKEARSVDETTRQLLNMAIDTGNRAYVDSLLEMVFDDKMTLLKAARAQRERMRMMMLTTGLISIEANGQSYNYDYGIPAEHKKTATVSWATPTTDIIADIQAWKQIIEDETGTAPTRAVCSRKTFGYIRNNEKIRKSLYPANDGIGMVTDKIVKDFVLEATDVDIVVYTKKYKDEAGAVKPYIADDTFVLFPEGNLGYTWFGTTPEESDLMSSNVANVAVVDMGVAVTTTEETDPVTVKTKASMVCLPSFEAADYILIADVTP